MSNPTASKIHPAGRSLIYVGAALLASCLTSPALHAQAGSSSIEHIGSAPVQPAQDAIAVEGFALDRELRPSAKPGPNPATLNYRRVKHNGPSKDRVKQIQQALLNLGYLTGKNPVDGDWGPKSEAALKLFQKDQGLRQDGKLGAWTLTALDLGPQHEDPSKSLAGWQQGGAASPMAGLSTANE